MWVWLNLVKLLRGSRPTLFKKTRKITLRNLNLKKTKYLAVFMDEIARIIPNNHNIWIQIRNIMHLWLHHFIHVVAILAFLTFFNEACYFRCLISKFHDNLFVERCNLGFVMTTTLTCPLPLPRRGVCGGVLPMKSI